MAVRLVQPRWAVFLIATMLVAACGATSASDRPVDSPGGPPISSSPIVGSATEPSPPVIDYEDPARTVIAAELALREEDRGRAGLEDLGSGAVELAAAMDASAARLLARARADAAGEGGIDPLAGQVAALGPFAPAPGYDSMLVWGTLITSLDDFARDPRSGTVEGEPETVEIAGNTGTITTTMTLNSVVSGDQLSVDLTIKTKGQVVDKASGAVLFGIDSIASGHIDVVFCPDAAGKAAANVRLTSSEIYTGGGAGSGGKGTAREFTGAVTITVRDDAFIAAVDGTANAKEDSKGGIPPAGSTEGDVPASSRTASDNFANDGQGRRRADVPRDIKVGGEGTTVDEQIKAWGSMSLFVDTMVTAAAEEAQKLWRSGKCVELIVDPDGGDIGANQTQSVTAKLRHKIDGNELDKPIEATLGGVRALDPADGKQPAPATVEYTSGPNDGDSGRITFRSTSNRGIAEKTVTFVVGSSGWDVSFDGTDAEVFAIVKNAFKVRISDFTIKADDAVLTGSGKLHLTGTVRSGQCKGSLDQVATINVFEGTLIGAGTPEAVLRLTIRGVSPAGQSVHLRCIPAGGADIPAEGHAERIGEPLMQFDLPAAGGMVRVSKSTLVGGLFKVTLKGTFTVTPTKP